MSRCHLDPELRKSIDGSFSDRDVSPGPSLHTKLDGTAVEHHDEAGRSNAVGAHAHMQSVSPRTAAHGHAGGGGGEGKNLASSSHLNSTNNSNNAVKSFLHSRPLDLDGVGVELPDTPSPEAQQQQQRVTSSGCAKAAGCMVVTTDLFQSYEELLCSHYLPDISKQCHDWDMGACEAAHENQSGVCIRGCCCVTLPCVLYDERRTLLFHSIAARYVCCAGVIPLIAATAH